MLFALLEGIAWVGVKVLERSGLNEDISDYIASATEAQKRANPKYSPPRGLGPDFDEVLHPYVGFVLTASDPARQDLNDLGWIQPTLFKRSPERLVVAVTGGSVARQIYEVAGATLKQDLQQIPRFQHKEIVLVGLCLGGYKQPQQLMILNYLLTLGGEFDLVINLDGFNEVALHEPENGAKGVFPIYPRWWQQRVNDISDPDMLADAGQLAYLQRQLKSLDSSPLLRFASHLQMGRLWRAFRIKRLHTQMDAVIARLSRTGTGAARRYVSTGPRWKFEETQLYDELTDIWSRSSLQMHQLSQANGIAYYHFLQPNQYVEGSKPMGSAERKKAYDGRMRYRPGAVKGYPKLIAKGKQLAERGVKYTDLTQLFAKVDAPMYRDTCCHLLPEGADAVAHEIARVIGSDTPP